MENYENSIKTCKIRKFQPMQSLLIHSYDFSTDADNQTMMKSSALNDANADLWVHRTMTIWKFQDGIDLMYSGI